METVSHDIMKEETDTSYTRSIGAGLLTLVFLGGVGFLLYWALFNVS